MRLLVTFWSKNEEWNDLHWVREVFYLWAAQKVTTPCVFLTFFKLYKWYQIAQSVSNFRLVSVDCSLAGGLIAKKRNLSIDDKFGETFKRFLLSHNEIVKSRKLIIYFTKDTDWSTQLVITCLKLAIETLEQSVKYVQSEQ